MSLDPSLIVRPASPVTFRSIAFDEDGPSLPSRTSTAAATLGLSAAERAARSEAIEKEALAARKAKLEAVKQRESLTFGPASPVSKDPAYYRQYVHDVYTVIVGRMKAGARGAGATDPNQWLYKSIELADFSLELWEAVELARASPAGAGGLGRGATSKEQQTHNRLVFDLIKEIIENRNGSSKKTGPFQASVRAAHSSEFRYGRLTISVFNFMREVEGNVIDSLFPKRPQCPPRATAKEMADVEGDYIDFLARKSAAEEMERELYEADMFADAAAEDPVLLAIYKEITDLQTEYKDREAPPAVVERFRVLSELLEAQMNKLLDSSGFIDEPPADRCVGSATSSASTESASVLRLSSSRGSLAPSPALLSDGVGLSSSRGSLEASPTPLSVGAGFAFISEVEQPAPKGAPEFAKAAPEMSSACLYVTEGIQRKAILRPIP